METPYRAEVVWDRPEPGPRTPLTRAAIVEAAIRLADPDGLAAASVRRVAAALDVGPMRLYRYIDSTDELAELMVDEVYGEIMTGLRRAREWRVRVRRLAVRTRTVMLAHEWASDLCVDRPNLGPHGLVWLEELAGALEASPAVDGTGELWVALGAVSGFLFGSIRAEVADRRSTRTGDRKSEWHVRMAPYITRMLETGRYPTVRTLMTAGARPKPDRAFARGLDVVLDGLDASAAGVDSA